MLASEAPSTQKETESPRHESVPVAPKVVPSGDFGAVAAAGFLGDAALSGRANAGVRTLAMQQTQQTHGNRFAQRAAAGLFIQRHCACGGTCEKCKAEEDSPTSPAEPNEESARFIQRQAIGAPALATNESDGHSVIPPGSGQPLDEETREFMESRFGTDFSNVRVHTDSRAANSAEALHANAYTTGRDIYFARGKYAPPSLQGRQLLAHELTHTIQQREATINTAAVEDTHHDITFGRVNDPLEQEADRIAQRVVSVPTPLAVDLSVSPTSRLPPALQRQSADVAQTTAASPPQTTPDDPALTAGLEGEIDAAYSGMNQDADLLLRATASRMHLLLTWRAHPPFRTRDELDRFVAECSELAKTELGTLGAFGPAGVELALAFYPKGFPLTWSGRVQAALTMGVDPAGILADWAKSLADLVAQSKSLEPEISAHGLPVSLGKIADRLPNFRLRIADANPNPDRETAVRNYARGSIRYMQLKFVLAFAFMWENFVNQIASAVADGTIVPNYLDWKDFVDNKQAILRDLPNRARERLAKNEDEAQQIQTDALTLTTFKLSDTASLVGLASAFTSLFGILSAWSEAESLFAAALATADNSVAESGGGSRIVSALQWAWANDYFGGAAAAWGQNLIEHGPEIIGEIALIVILQAIPGVDIALDAYLAFTSARDVIGMIDELGSSLSEVMNAASVGELQKAAAKLAQILTSGAIQIMIVLVTLGIGKAAARVRKRAGATSKGDKALTAEAAEKKALEEMSAAERKPLEEAAQKIEEFDRRYTPETKPILEVPGVRAKLAEISEEARALLELCESPCLPPPHQLLDADLKMLENVQKRLGRPGYDRGLKEYFYRRRWAPGGL